MKRILSTLYLLLLVLLGGSRLSAQVYTCDFEDPNERAQWQLNVGPLGSRCLNKWYIGSAGNHSSTGSYGLFVSSDGTTNNYNTTNTMFVVAYREITLPAGNYLLSYDWNMIGQSGDALYACFVPSTQATNSAPSTANVPAYVLNDHIDSLQGSQLWCVQNTPFVSDGTPHKLLFMWFNKQGNAAPPAACVDNINIFRVSDLASCHAPTNIRHTLNNDGSLDLRWDGTAQSYDVVSYDPINDKWQEFTNVSGNSVNIQGLAEGVQSFKVRASCGSDSKSYYVGYNSFIWLKGQRCIEYLDLDAATCYTYGKGGQRRNGKIDHGFHRWESHHTIHYMPTEYDGRTGGRLKTVPEGELASVRLGNWPGGSTSPNDSTDVIEYRYTVPQGAGEILKIKYALVLQQGGHDSVVNPRFVLDILDSRGRPISVDGCGSASFSAGYGVTLGDWHTYTEGSNEIWWMDWNELSISLRDYVGQTLTIHLEQHDCGQTVHYGYGYFVINCESGELHGLNCMEPTTHFEAPDGFYYRWYKAADPSTVLGTNQTFDNAGPMDTTLYLCDVISMANTRCWYTLEASGIPRYPVPEVSWTRDAQCTNVYNFTNTSHVMTVNQVSGDTTYTTTAVDSVYWDFGDGTPVTFNNSPSVRHEFPFTGGTYTVNISAVIDYCTLSQQYTIEVPDLSTRRQELDVHICDGQSFIFNGRTYFNSYTDSVVTTSLVTGCDSVCVLNLTVHDTTALHIFDTICLPQLYVFNGDTLTRSGDYKAFLRNIYNCDSVISLHLTVYDWQQGITVSHVPDICFGDASFTLLAEASALSDSIFLYLTDTAGSWSSQVINVQPSTDLTIPLDGRAPGRYWLRLGLFNPYCRPYQDSVSFTVRYPASVMQQKWNDVIAVKNADYNGGYDFVAFQWYLDGVELLGQTRSYIYIPDTLQMGHEYSVLLTEDNGKRYFSCPLVPEPHTDITAYPTLLSAGGAQPVHVRVPEPAQAVVYTATGSPVSTRRLQRGSNTLNLPLTPGVYLLRITPDTTEARSFRLVVK